MAHYRAEIRGMRGEASRLGTKSSGISGHIAGWDIGASVRIHYDTEKKQNVLFISVDNGNGYDQETIKSFSFAVTREGIQEIE